MDSRLLLILLLWGLFVPDGSDEGRSGNEHFRAGRFEEAAQAYLAGLDAAPADESELRARLYQNLGSARYRAEAYREARSAFEQGLRTTGDPRLETALAHGAGNAAYGQKELRAASEFYRRALLAEPDNRAAKYNYEFVQRQLERNRSGSSGQNQNDQNRQQNQDSSSNSGQQNGDRSSSRNQQSGSDQSPSSEGQGQNQSGSDQGEQQRQNQGQNQSQSRGQNPGDRSQDQGEGEAEESGQPRDGSAESARGPARAGQLSQEEARRILQALETSEKQLLREMRREQRDRSAEPPEKDW